MVIIIKFWQFFKKRAIADHHRLYLLYTLLFVGIWGLWVLPFLLRGNGSISLGDGFNQYYPAFVYIGNYIRNTVSSFFINGIGQFDFRIGLGDDVFATLNYYGFGDILSSLSALAPLKYAELVFSGVLLLRYYLCGFTFIIYCKNYVNNPYLRICGGLMYAGCTFGLLFGMRFFMFLTPMITLPLILRGVDDLLSQDRTSKRRLSKWLILGLFFQALNGFYFLYMQIIIVIIYFCVVAFIRQRNKFFTYILPMTLHGLLGIALGGYILLPAIYGVFNSNRLTSGPSFTSLGELFVFHDVRYYLTKLSQLIIPEAYKASTTIPLIMLVGIIFLWGSVKKHKEFRWLLGITGLLFLLPFMGVIMNGFSIATDRWYYAILLFGSIGTLLALQEEGWFLSSRRLIFYLIAFLSLTANIITSEWTLGTALRTAVYSFLIYIVPYLLKPQRKREQRILIYVSVTVTVSGLFLLGPRVLGGSGFSAEFKGYGETAMEMEASISIINDGTVNNSTVIDNHTINNTGNMITDTNNSFARWDTYSSSRGTSLVMDYYGTTEYFSVMNRYVIDFFNSLLISPGINGGSFDTLGLDGRIELESLLSVSNYMDFVSTDDAVSSIMVDNPLALPLGFTYDNWISREQFEQQDPLEKMSTLTSTAVMEEQIITSQTGSSDHSVANIPIEIAVEYLNISRYGDLLYTDSNEDGKIRIWLADHRWYDDYADKKGELYIKLEQLSLNTNEWRNIMVGNKSLQLRNNLIDYSNYVVHPEDFWVNITELQFNGDDYYFDIYSLGENEFSLRDIKVFYHPINQTAINERRDNFLENLTFETNRISGSITSDKPELLFLSVPYSTGWSAVVDGEKVPVYRTNIAFISVLLEPGEHDIRFTYQTPGLKMGFYLSLCALIIIMILNRFTADKRL
jgi:uncharacterized membrane protein YfhO